MSYIHFLQKEKNPHIKTLIDDIRAHRDPDFFAPFGTQVHVGRQGSGKTISAVHTLLKLKARYPRAIVVSNLSLKGYDKVPVSSSGDDGTRRTLSPREVRAVVRELAPRRQYVFFQDADELQAVLVGVNNGYHGVIYLIDEIHTYFNALDSKNVPMHVFTEISQQRKQRKLIIGTSQLFMRMAKPLREQCDNVIFCNTIAGFITVMRVYDGMELEQDYSGHLIGRKRKTAWFAHDKKTREAFDTYQKIISTDVQYEQFQQLHVNKRQTKAFRKVIK